MYRAFFPFEVCIMARNKVIQVACPPDLYSQIKDYKEAKNLTSDADAMRELTLFALRVIEHSSDKDEGISTRELLEVLLENVVKIHHQTSINYYQNFNEEQYNTNMKAVDIAPSYKRLMVKAEERTKQILEGDKV
jgi:hypothetical protein